MPILAFLRWPMGAEPYRLKLAAAHSNTVQHYGRNKTLGLGWSFSERSDQLLLDEFHGRDRSEK